MSKKKHILDYFPKAIFWDVNPDKLSFKENKQFIIERVLSWNMGENQWMESLEEVYSIKDIKHFALGSSQIFGNENIQFIADRYDLNVEDFQKWISDFSKYA